jgi:hypothetical protein
MSKVSQLRQTIANIHKRGVEVAAKIRALATQEQRLIEENKRNREALALVLKEEHKNQPFLTMFDSVAPKEIPLNAKAVAGYVGGNWPTFDSLRAKFPNAKRLSVAVNASEFADCLDVETGDAIPADAPGFIKREKARLTPLGRKPWIYSDGSNMPVVISACGNAGIQRSEYNYWLADPDGVPHLPVNVEAKQYTWHAFGRDLDASVVRFGLL